MKGKGSGARVFAFKCQFNQSHRSYMTLGSSLICEME